MSQFRPEQFASIEQGEALIQDPFGDVTEAQVAADMEEIGKTNPELLASIAESQQG